MRGAIAPRIQFLRSFILQYIIDTITKNGAASLDFKAISHYCAQSVQSPLSRVVLFNSAVHSDDPDRCMFAMKKLMEANEDLLALLLSGMAKLKPNMKSWHGKWLDDAQEVSDLCVDYAPAKVFVIGDSGFLQGDLMKSSGLEGWLYLDDNMSFESIVQEMARYIDEFESNPLAGGIAFVSARCFKANQNHWKVVSTLLGIRIIRVTENGGLYFEADDERFKLDGISDAVVYVLLKRFFELSRIPTNKQLVFEALFSKCPLRPLNVSFRELLGPDFKKMFRSEGKSDEKQLLKYSKVLNDSGLHSACIDFINMIPRDSWGKFTHKWYINSLFNLAEFGTVVQTCKELTRISKLSQAQLLESLAIIEMKKLLESSGNKPAPSSSNNKRSSMVSILHACPPYQSGGYVNRAHGILKSLSGLGWEITGIARPGFPESGTERGNVHIYDGVRYLTSDSKRRRRDGEYQYMRSTVDYYLSVFREMKPSVVHLRSTYVSALPALIAARSLNIPTFYEVSGMWELVYAHKSDPSFVGKYNRTIYLENLVYDNSDKIVTSTNFMKKIIESRMSKESTVEIVPNAVDPETFRPMGKDLSLLDELKWGHESIVFGYLGSFVDYEGLELLIDAFADLYRLVPSVKLLLVGDGAMMNAVRMKIIQTDLTKVIKLTGRVPHREIPRYYSIVDVTPFPRLDTPATRAVAPLKPFEAMASGKSVVVSDLDALIEIVKNGEYGWIFKAGSKESLTEALRDACESSSTKRDSAISWVRTNRTWSNVGRKIDDVISRMSTQ